MRQERCKRLADPKARMNGVVIQVIQKMFDGNKIDICAFTQVTRTQVKCSLKRVTKITQNNHGRKSSVEVVQHSEGYGGYVYADEFMPRTAKRAAYENACARLEALA